MDMRDLLVLVEGEATAAAPYALSMGLHLEAHLTAVAFVQQRLSVGPFAELPHNLLEAMYEESCRAAERALEQVRGTGFSWVETELMAVPAGQSTEDCFRWLARHFDLVIVQQRAPDGPVNDSTVEAALFGSGRPVLVVPYVHAAPARFATVLIAWDESATAARAIGDALPLLKLADRVEVVTIAEPRRRERVSPPRAWFSTCIVTGSRRRSHCCRRRAGRPRPCCRGPPTWAPTFSSWAAMAIPGCASWCSAEQLGRCSRR